jgi:hypothetical protein
VIETWISEGVVGGEDAERLKNSVERARFDWKRLAVYSFWIAGLSIAISVFALVFDRAILKLIEKILTIPDMMKAGILAILAAGLYYWGFRRKRTRAARAFTNESLLFFGAILTGLAVTFFGLAVDTGSGRYSLLILAASLVYLGVGAFFPSAPMWVLGLISVGTWFGTETGYMSGWGAYFLGMNFPLRFVLLGILLAAAAFRMRRTRFSPLERSTFIVGLLNLFISLWILSIWGNYGDMDAWHQASVLERFFWSLLFGGAAVGSIIWGLKNDDGAARGFGITFLFINLYTKYFEYFWNVSHKAIFFALLGVSFWFLGRYAEKAYTALKV